MLPVGLVRSSSPLTAVYIPKDFFLHATSLRQTFVHCGIFVAAATRRCPGSVSVPMWRATLSRPLPVVALVGRYPTNKLIGHEPIPDRRSFARRTMRFRGIIGYYRHFRKGTEVPPLFPSPGFVVHVFLTRSPLTHQSVSFMIRPFDLHALATPPAFVLSQDQTLHFKFVSKRPTRRSSS